MPQNLSRPQLQNQFIRTMPGYLQHLLPRSGVLTLLVSCLPNPPIEVISDWGLTVAEVERLSLRGCPNETQNINAAHEVASRCDTSLLTSDIGFYSYEINPTLCDYCLPGQCVCSQFPTWRIDIDPSLASHGIIVPIHEPRYRWIVDLKVFRSTRDTKPFSLRVRQREAIAA